MIETKCLSADYHSGTIDMIQQVQQTHQPVFLTIDGKPEAVLMDADEYQKVLNALAMAKLLLKSERDIAENKVLPVREFFRKFRCDKII